MNLKNVGALWRVLHIPELSKTSQWCRLSSSFGPEKWSSHIGLYHMLLMGPSNTDDWACLCTSFQVLNTTWELGLGWCLDFGLGLSHWKPPGAKLWDNDLPLKVGNWSLRGSAHGPRWRGRRPSLSVMEEAEKGKFPATLQALTGFPQAVTATLWQMVAKLLAVIPRLGPAVQGSWQQTRSQS